VAQHRLAERFDLVPVMRLEQLRGPTTGPEAGVATPPGVTLRGYRPDDPHDLDAVVAIHNVAFSTEQVTGELVAERLARTFMGPDHLVMAELDGHPAGFVWMASPRPDGEGDGHGELVFLAVDPGAAGRGVGRALVAAGLGLLAGLGVERCMLYVEADNTPALRLYRRAGLRLHHADVLLAPRGEGLAEVAW
jgi:mycothiol synthase